MHAFCYIAEIVLLIAFFPLFIITRLDVHKLHTRIVLQNAIDIYLKRCVVVDVCAGIRLLVARIIDSVAPYIQTATNEQNADNHK
ncbi:MAG: hypothetical protein A2666_03115 [Parcubacteria group bacterium RIFCSPHIGHO2_01_FULL_47_10b]|nr:MAG: hypothetical protein A2666_03115 [Parcubacteria group bacterium RIFCSPHIGHO2_01_FULL_47_10b]